MKGHIMDIFEARRGFTVIELAAVVVAMGSLGVYFGPASRQIQKNNLDTRSQWVHHELARRQFVYMGDNNGAFTGPNTSGAAWNRDLIDSFSNNGIEILEFDTAGGNPTNMSDWITPLVGDAYGFSANRAIRTQQKFEVMADPTTDRMVDFVFTSSGVADLEQFNEVLSTSGYRQRSFLQIRSFSHLSSEQRPSDVVIDVQNDIGYVERFAVQNQNDMAMSPKGYMPNIMNVGKQLSNKVMFADGTRFWEDGSGLDFSAEAITSISVDESDASPIFHRSIAYGRANGLSPSQMNIELSYRKQGGAGMYVTMFDGSLRYMTREESWTDPTPWYPSGSVWQNSENATPESQAWVKKNLSGGVIH